jgi:hypothetical protein
MSTPVERRSHKAGLVVRPAAPPWTLSDEIHRLMRADASLTRGAAKMRVQAEQPQAPPQAPRMRSRR